LNLPWLLCDKADGWDEGGGGPYDGTFLPNPWQGLALVVLASSIHVSSCYNKSPK
jgi:hypothetical protein